MSIAEANCATPLVVRCRSDLVSSEQWHGGRRLYVVKDPLALKYYRFSESEHAVLRMLDRHRAPDEIACRLAEQFPELQLGAGEIKSFIASLYANGLVVSDGPQQGRKLVERRNAQRRGRWRRLATNVLFIRSPGIDPTTLLDVLYPWIGWFFSRRTMAVVAMLAAVALAVLATRAAELTAELVAMHDYFGPGNWLLLALTFAVTKMLHELGHALACRRCGGECREIGVMFLVLTPCLYCDVSDSWMLPSKWQRAAIAAAGMYVEVTLAALATLVWAQSEPGTLHYLALQVILVCSVSTLLFNGNPLARYDGYYILADLVEVPNLREEARAALTTRLWRLVGIERRGASRNPSWRLTLFGLGVVVYRWVLLASILWVLHQILAARGLEVAWQFIALSVLFSVVVAPTWRLVRALKRKELVHSMNRRRLLTAAALALAAVACFVLVPLPRRIRGTFETRYAGAALVYAPYAGVLERVHIEHHQPIRRGAPIAELRSIDLEFEIARLSAEVQSYERGLRSLQLERFHDPRAIERIGQTEQLLASSRAQLAERKTARAQFQLVAPRDGFVLPPTRRPAAGDGATLASWSGAPLDARNRGTPLAPGDVVCEIGDPRQLEAVLIVDQADVERLKVGQRVNLVCDAQPWRTHHGEVTAIAIDALEATPPGLAVRDGGQIPTRTDAAGFDRPATPSYAVTVSLSESQMPPAAGMRGSARIVAGRETLAAGAWRYVCRTFRFDW